MKNSGNIVLLLFAFICLNIASVNAQQSRVFSGEISAYPEELSAFIQKNVNPQSETALADFLAVWTKDSLFSKAEQEKIVAVSQDLIKRNARPYPHFTHYLGFLVTMKRKPALAEKFTGWDKAFDMLMASKKTTLQAMDRYLVFVRQLADSSALFRTTTVEWKINTPDYRFIIDSTVRIRITNTDLTCFVRKDSMNILGTEGDFFPLTSTWKGKGGIVTWERAGFKRDEVYAQLESYEINMTRSEYSARDAVFVNKFYFNAPLKGILTDKVKFNKTPADADYPEFNSYQKDFKIKELYKQIDFEGGLSMQGAKLVGTGNREKQAKIFIYRKDTLVLVASSNYFAFKADRINATTAGILIKLKSDSIFHHGLALSYMVATRELTLFRTENFTSQSPYFDSYHNIDMTFEQLVWKMDEPVMRFTGMMGSQTGEANFESVNFYNNDQFMAMQLMDEVHPLIQIRSFAKRMGTEQFLAEDFANYLQKPLAQVKQLLMRMAARGFLFYDTENDMVTIRPRLHDYIAASVAKVDYDVISIPSAVNAPLENAIFDLRNYDLTINGIPRIFVSDSQNVVIYPDNDRIVMKKNRHFQFNGQVQAGLFTFSGKNFFFNYDTFKIKLQKIDSLHIRYLTDQYDNYGFPITEEAQTLLEDMKGEIYIDRPDNKSGRNSYPEYPVFVSEENGHVYYDSKKIHNGVYTRDKFFFRIDPFTMDSIDNFNRRSMKFDGELASAGILPNLRETLKLQPDNSLGFQHATPDSGLTIYGGKGLFSNQLSLTNKGLTGSGTIRYLTSVTSSEDIQFFPDSLNAVTRDFTIAQSTSGTQYPSVKTESAQIHWLPYKDELYANMSGSRFNMFNPSTSLAGNLKLTPTGLTGNGRIYFEGAELRSDMFSFKANEIDADTSDFYLKSLHAEGFTVLTENIKSHIDFTAGRGTFRSNEDFTLVSFPENKYVSFLDNFEWDMSKKILAMGSSTASPVDTTSGEVSGPRYISTDSEQDSLSFISPLAYYDYDSLLIKATAVKYIDIADARIYPFEERLTVQRDARLRTLYKANLTANRNTQYYKMYNATLTIAARNKYIGSAYYNYVDELKQEEPIYFNSLAVDNNIQTIGTGEIQSEDDFTLSPNYRYQGKVFLEASSQFLTFDGGTLIEHNCDMIPTRWMHFRSEIDPMNILIPVNEELIDVERNRIFNGLYMYYDSLHVYPAFLSGRKFSSDVPVSTATGFLYYNHEKQEYQIGSKEKLLDPALPGNLLTLHRENCLLYGEGKINTGAQLGQVKISAVGNMTHNSIENKTELNVMLGFDFYIADNIINVMAAEIDSFPSLPAVDLNNPVITKGTIDLIGKEKYDAMKSELSLFGTLKTAPAELKHTIMFNMLKLRWDDESNSWVSVGKIGVASINNVQINKQVDGLLELQIKRSGDILDFYLQIDRRTWYYFGYTRGVMQIHSSNREFLDKMEKLKPTERRLKVTGGGEESYIYMISTDVKKNSFLRRYRDLQEQEQEVPQP
jgi:hypothetical protein